MDSYAVLVIYDSMHRLISSHLISFRLNQVAVTNQKNQKRANWD